MTKSLLSLLNLEVSILVSMEQVSVSEKILSNAMVSVGWQR